MKPVAWIRCLPWSIPLLAAALVALGWLAIARCEVLSDGTGRFLHRQMMWSVLGAAVMIAASIPNYRRWRPWSYAVFAVSLALLAAVYLFAPVNGVRRWIHFGPLSAQPSEFAKVAFVLALARYLMHRENYRRLRGLLVPLAIAMVPVLLVMREPDLGTAAVFVPVLFAMLFAAGVRRSDLAWLLVVGILLLPLLWTQMSGEQKSRVTAVFHQPSAGERPGSDGYQLYQAKQVLALGGTWGSLLGGPATEDHAAYRLPYAESDFIFCMLGERLGLAGLGLVLTLYGVLVWRAAAIAAATREPFGRLVATGVATLLAVQVLINTGMAVGLLPVKGLPLPLVSYGGSGLLAHAIALGLLLNVGLRPGYEVTKEPFRWALEHRG
jgi:rod shape determining protein RodA